ncbi:FtsX-like permease family protein [Pelagibacterales bacterium SAG-MED17]|nr:FtsX-like permease family protein [Pelagibacterales bacterium SAG-MED17]
MISQLEREVAFRFLKTRKNDGFLNIISIFSFIGISLGVAVLIIVMSVMNGFRTELITKIVGFNAHAVVQSNNNTLTLAQDSDFTEITLSNDGEAVILNKNNTKGIFLKGYLENNFKNLKIVNNAEYNGSIQLNENSISIGRELSINLNVDIGDTITIMSPVGIQTLVGTLPKQETFEIISIFDSGLSDYNKNIAYINLETLENFFNKDKENRFLEFYFKNPKNIEIHKKKLLTLFPNALIYTWSDMNKSLFSALKVERNVMFIIISLIIIVAAFNIISGLTILVKNKTRDIGILKSIGVSSKSIKKIFFFVGFFIGTSATLFGVIVGTLFSVYIENIRQFISNIFGVTLFPEDIYILNSMPSEISISSIIIISLCSIVATILVSIYPASKASSLDTIKTLKYE